MRSDAEDQGDESDASVRYSWECPDIDSPGVAACAGVGAMAGDAAGAFCAGAAGEDVGLAALRLKANLDLGAAEDRRVSSCASTSLSCWMNVSSAITRHDGSTNHCAAHLVNLSLIVSW